MANRVVPDEVRAIMPETTLDDLIIETYITSAHVWVDSLLVTKYDEEVLKEIERWMSAHMIAMTQERQAKEEGAGGAFIKYTGDWGEGLLGTSYGQMVYNLDVFGWIPCIGCKGEGGTNRRRVAWSKAVPGV